MGSIGVSAMRRVRLAMLAVLVLACSDAPREDRAPDDAAEDAVPAPPADTSPPEQRTMTLYYTRNEQPVAVERSVTDSVTLAAALAALLAGPTEAERALGLTSWFSAETADMLRSAHVDSAGHAIVDFGNLAAVIPSASSSTGSTMLLTELNRTVFELPGIRSVEYRSEGSCAAFWNWLQYGCQVVRRP